MFSVNKSLHFVEFFDVMTKIGKIGKLIKCSCILKCYIV